MKLPLSVFQDFEIVQLMYLLIDIFLHEISFLKS